MIILGVILLVVGLVTGIAILWTIGIILAVIGAILWLVGAMGTRRCRTTPLLVTSQERVTQGPARPGWGGKDQLSAGDGHRTPGDINFPPAGTFVFFRTTGKE